jgi:P27 family predicted phage terminase small subunit
MGRKAMPIDLLLLQGNKNRLTKDEIKARKETEEKIKPKSDKIKPPKKLSVAAKTMFNQLVQELQITGLITNVDIYQLAMYCRAYTRWEELCEGEEQEDGTIIYDEKKIDLLFKQVKSMGAEYGFTPSSRAKLAMPREEEKLPSNEAERRFGDRV